MKIFHKNCVLCECHFLAKGPAGKYCPSCAECVAEQTRIKNAARSHEYKVQRNMIRNPYSGSGSATGRGIENHMYKTGKYVIDSLRQEIKESKRYCERCSEDLIEATHYLWVVHHKDHNHNNQDSSNLELLCKRCHQIEHECWKAFSKAQRLSRKGVESSDSKRVGSVKGA
jgi:hypothetical protein